MKQSIQLQMTLIYNTPYIPIGKTVASGQTDFVWSESVLFAKTLPWGKGLSQKDYSNPFQWIIESISMQKLKTKTNNDQMTRIKNTIRTWRQKLVRVNDSKRKQALCQSAAKKNHWILTEWFLLGTAILTLYSLLSFCFKCTRAFSTNLSLDKEQILTLMSLSCFGLSGDFLTWSVADSAQRTHAYNLQYDLLK